MAGENRSARILVVEDDASVNALLLEVLRGEGYRVEGVQDGARALPAADELAPDLVLLDIHLPGADGIDLLKALHGRTPPVSVIMISGERSVPTVVEAIRLGAFDYVAKPFQIDKLLIAVRNALVLARREREVAELRAQVAGPFDLRNVVGESPALSRARETARKVVGSTAPILIRGESGTGKELFARAMHFGGPRREAPFIAVNCAALPEPLLESELFGHEKGSFTGAAARRIVKFEQADGGTLFLDEIGDMPLSIQAKLLRILQEQVFERVGGTEQIRVDVRILSATHQNLEELIRGKQFREDLFYRINTVTITIPPLRERAGDILLLAGRFLEEFAARERKKIEGFTPAAAEALGRHRWKGNIRELRNAVERAVLLGDGPRIDVGDLPPLGEAPAGTDAVPRADGTTDGAKAAGPGLPGPEASVNLEEAVEAFEKAAIRRALLRHDGVKARAARDLGLTEKIIGYKIDKYKIDLKDRPPG